MNNSPDNNTSRNYDFESIQLQNSGNRPNPYASSFNEDNAEYVRQLSARRNNMNQQQINDRRKVRKKQPAFKFNWGMLLFALLIAAIVIFSVFQIVRNRPAHDDNNGGYVEPPLDNVVDDQPEDGTGTDEGGESDPADTTEVTDLKTFTVTVNSSDEDCGDLILVNYDHDFSENADYIPVINVYEKRSAPFKVASTDIELSPIAFAAFEKMVNALNKDTGCDDMIINSGYRTLDDQKEIYEYYLETKGEEYAKEYVANPGESEHHTGYAADLSFFLDEGYSDPIDTHEHGKWITDHCTDYGFIVRYPSDKVEYTHIAYEAWHFRYVGEVHAKAITSLGLCLEEYIDLLKDCTLDTKVIHVTDDGKASVVPADELTGKKNGYAIYSATITEDENEITILGEEGADYSCSGTNSGMFVVTVPLG